MTDPTPTPQAPPQGLTDARLLELAEKELCIDDMQDAHEEHYPIEVVTDGLIAAMRAAIAAHEAARVGLHCYLDDDGPCPSPCVFDDPAEQISNCTYAQGLQRNGEPKTSCPHYRTTPTPQTPPQGLTDAQLDALERQHWEATGVVSEAMQAEELFNYRAFARAAIAAHEAQRMEWLKGSREIAILTAAIDGRIAAHEAARPTPTPEALQAAYAAWFKAEQGIAPLSQAARTAAAFALAVLRGEVKPPQEVQ